MDPEEDCKIINLRDARSSCYWFYEGNKKAAKGDGDNIEGNPHEEGDVEAVVLLFHAVISPLSQQCVLDLGQKLDGDVYGAGHKGGEHPHNKHHSPAEDILSKISINQINQFLEKNDEKCHSRIRFNLLEHKLVPLVPKFINQD